MRRPAVIAHRGASGQRPENTLAAFELAARLGADVVELDLVPSRDGRLVVRHEADLSLTTDVARRLPDGPWSAHELTAAQIARLHAVTRDPQRRPEAARFDATQRVPLLEDVLRLAATTRTGEGRRLGLRLELKHPGRFREVGLPVEEELLRLLAAHDLMRPDAGVSVQSFDADALRRLRWSGLPLVVLLHGRSPAPVVEELASWAAGLAVERSVLERTPSLLAAARARGLTVDAWTLERPCPDEHAAVAALGVDGIITDHPEAAAIPAPVALAA